MHAKAAKCVAVSLLVLCGCSPVADRSDQLARPDMVRLDRSFGHRGAVRPIEQESLGEALTHGTDGSVFVGGRTIPAGERSFDWTLLKFTEHGDPYRTYNVNAAREMQHWGGSVDDIAVAADGSVTLVGLMSRAGRDALRAAVVRLTPEGTLDRRFGRGGVLSVHSPNVHGVFLRVFSRDDGSVVVSRFVYRRPANDFEVFRLDRRGRSDRAFARGLQLPAAGFPILASDGNGRLLGAETDPDGVIRVFRLGSNGAMDHAFESNATRAIRRITASVPSYDRAVVGMTVDTADGIVVALDVGYYASRLIRLLSDGSIDRRFGRADEASVGGVILGLAADPFRGTIVLRSNPTTEAYVIRFGKDGRRDRRFGEDSHYAAYSSEERIDIGAGDVRPTDVDVDKGGRIVVAGSAAWPTVDDAQRLFMARYLVMRSRTGSL